MRKNRYSEREIIEVLREVEGSDSTVAEVLRSRGFSKIHTTNGKESIVVWKRQI